MTWGGIKKGDAVLEVYGDRIGGGQRARTRRAVAVAVGRKWITTDRGAKYAVNNGYGEYGWSLHTEATLDYTTRSEAAWSAIREAVSRETPGVSLEALEAFAAVIKAAKGAPEGGAS